MNRIETIFNECRVNNRGALMPFLTAGYPSLEVTRQLLPAMEHAGASICEIGFPFSDPVADGPVIQASMTQALKHNLTNAQIFDMVKSVRDQTNLGLVAMVSYSIVYRMGTNSFIQQAKDAGFDGFIFPDLPLEEADTVSNTVKEAGLTCSLLIAPSTPIKRAEQIISLCSGFVYILARTGITGERADLPEDLIDRLGTIKQMTDLPLAVGFGISQAKHVRSVTEVADAAIVGSAIVRRLSEHTNESVEQQVEHTCSLIKNLAEGLA